MPIQATSSHFLQEDAVWNAVKDFTKVQVDNIQSLSVIHYAGHLVIEGDQVSQTGPAFHKPMLTGPDHLVGTQADLLHNLPRHQGQTDWPVVPQILLPAPLVDGHYIC